MDAHVGARVFERVVCGYLAHKTVVVATHNTEMLRAFDTVIVLDGGGVTAVGPPDEVKTLLVERGDWIGRDGADAAIASGDVDVSEVTAVADGDHAAPGVAAPQPRTGAPIDDAPAVGAVAPAVRSAYVAALGSRLALVLLALSYVVSQAFIIGSDAWLAAWSSGAGDFSARTYLTLFAAISFGSVALFFVRSFALALAGLRASRALHSQMLASILAAPLRFFDDTASGRILSRFSKVGQGGRRCVWPH
jgi:ATP-binding cassette, subfamily C (CFTR/MRP), member 1